MVESQLFSSWAIVSVFAFLRDSDLAPEDKGFHKLVSSLSVVLNSQAKASFAAAEFLTQKRRETFVFHLLSHTHDSVWNALLSSKSSPSLFSDEVIEKSFGQVRGDSQLLLLKNLPSQKGGKGSVSSSSSSAQHHPCSQFPQSFFFSGYERLQESGFSFAFKPSFS